MTLPFTFAWVDETQTTFNPSTMNVFDEEIFSFEMKHEENQIPTLSITIINPRIGLLNPGRKVWAWLSWLGPSGLVPVFFGVLVGVPTSLFQEKVTLQFIARSSQYIENKQALAESMKVAPYYSPFWYEPSKADDPDSILEGYSKLWHIDRTTLDITASDVLVGEDGNVAFDEFSAYYNSVGLTLGQAPLTNIRVEATAQWTQRYSGYFTVPTLNLSSYTGETAFSEWPKPGQSIGAGYTIESSYANDIYNIGMTPTTSVTSTFTNADPNPGQCSTSSQTSSSSGPALLAPDPITYILTLYTASGVCFPDSDPPVNTPATVAVTGQIIPLWSLALDAYVRYDRQATYTEVLAFDLITNTQGILASPTVSQNTELLTLSSVDLGKPLFRIEAWSDFKNSSVGQGITIFPNNPTKPGGLAFQICLVSGIAGAVEPTFSDFPGVTTQDGTVTWVSLGLSPLTENPDWSPASFVPEGQIICFTDQTFNNASGKFEKVPGATSYYLCTTAGETNSNYRDFLYTPTIVTSDEAPPAQRLITVVDRPTFSQSAGQVISDGTVGWTVLGQSPATLSIPIGGTPAQVVAREFFPTDLGRYSIEYLICKARAHARIRTRAVTVSWDAPFALGVGLSCRHNATLFDPRLPGGAATGKVISYTLSASGNGKLNTHVEIGCAVGFGNSIPQITGTPEYAAAGYAQVGWQIYDGATTVLDSADTSYTMPASGVYDDGLQYPLNWKMVAPDGWKISGTIAAQKAAILAAVAVTQELNYLQRAPVLISSGQGSTSTTLGYDAAEAWAIEREELALGNHAIPAVMKVNPVSASALMKPATSGPFEGAYTIQITPLEVLQGINLESPSSP